MTATVPTYESPGEVLCRVMVQNPDLITVECERIAAAIVRDREMRTPTGTGGTRVPRPHPGDREPEPAGERPEDF